MTTSATILGMLPIALGFGEGAELRAPMAVAIIGGLVTSTVLSLVVVPVVYAIFDRIHPRFQEARRGRVSAGLSELTGLHYLVPDRAPGPCRNYRRHHQPAWESPPCRYRPFMLVAAFGLLDRRAPAWRRSR